MSKAFKLAGFLIASQFQHVADAMLDEEDDPNMNAYEESQQGAERLNAVLFAKHRREEIDGYFEGKHYAQAALQRDIQDAKIEIAIYEAEHLSRSV